MKIWNAYPTFPLGCLIQISTDYPLMTPKLSSLKHATFAIPHSVRGSRVQERPSRVALARPACPLPWLLAFPQSQWSNREIEAEIDTHRRYSVSQPNLRRGLGSLLPCCIGHTESNPGTVCVWGGHTTVGTRRGGRWGHHGGCGPQDLKLNVPQMEPLNLSLRAQTLLHHLTL